MRKNRSSLVAWAVGGAWKPGNGNSIIAAHTDSPCLKVKPVSKITGQGALQVGVAPYGGFALLLSVLLMMNYDRDPF